LTCSARHSELLLDYLKAVTVQVKTELFGVTLMRASGNSLTAETSLCKQFTEAL